MPPPIFSHFGVQVATRSSRRMLLIYGGETRLNAQDSSEGCNSTTVPKLANFVNICSRGSSYLLTDDWALETLQILLIYPVSYRRAVLREP